MTVIPFSAKLIHMKPRSRREVFPHHRRSVDEEVGNLLEMFEFYLVERSLGRPVEALAEAVRDMRIIVGRLLLAHFIRMEEEQEADFCARLATMLAERCTRLPSEQKGDREYYDYVIGEILAAFEWAQEIKGEYPDDEEIQLLLMQDIPVLRPFDYGLKGRLRLIHFAPLEKKSRG